MRRKRHVLPRRSAVEWSIRGVLAALALIVGYVSVTQTMAYPLRSSDVRRAHSLSPGDGRITGLLAETIANPQASGDDRKRGDRLARTALQQDPTAISAVSTLGIDAQVRGDTASARRLFAYAGRLSRRHLITQLWAIEDAVGRGDIPAALHHYDIALRTSRTAPDLLFPVLAAAIAEPAVRASLTRTLAARPSWTQAFLSFVSVRGPDPRATAHLLIGLRRIGLYVSDGASAEIVNLLIFNKLLDDAWRYYAAVRPGVDRRQSRDPDFSAELSSASPLDWVPVNEGGVVTSIQRGERGGIFDFAVPASIGGPLLRQVQLLPPGRYRLDGHAGGIEQPAASAPYWVLSCSDGRELGRVTLSGAGQAGGRFTGRFDVPADCTVQTLTLVARPSDAISGITGQVDRVRLNPVSQEARQKQM